MRLGQEMAGGTLGNVVAHLLGLRQRLGELIHGPLRIVPRQGRATVAKGGAHGDLIRARLGRVEQPSEVLRRIRVLSRLGDTQGELGVIRGLERSDSVVMDPHKGLFLPYGTGALIVKDGELLARSQHYEANYLQDALSSTEEISPADLSPELTRHFRGLRMWMPLVLHGLAPFRAALEEKIQLCRYFYEELGKIPPMELVEDRLIEQFGIVFEREMSEQRIED